MLFLGVAVAGGQAPDETGLESGVDAEHAPAEIQSLLPGEQKESVSSGNRPGCRERRTAQ